MKVILQNEHDMWEQINAASQALRYWEENPPKNGDIIGFRFGEKFFGVIKRKNSISVYPQ